MFTKVLRYRPGNRVTGPICLRPAGGAAVFFRVKRMELGGSVRQQRRDMARELECGRTARRWGKRHDTK